MSAPTARFRLNQPVTFTHAGESFRAEISGISTRSDGTRCYQVEVHLPEGTTETVADEAELSEDEAARGNPIGWEFV